MEHFLNILISAKVEKKKKRYSRIKDFVQWNIKSTLTHLHFLLSSFKPFDAKIFLIKELTKETISLVSINVRNFPIKKDTH